MAKAAGGQRSECRDDLPDLQIVDLPRIGCYDRLHRSPEALGQKEKGITGLNRQKPLGHGIGGGGRRSEYR